MNPRRLFVRLLPAVLGLMAAAPAGADSDGYYCAAEGYLAWETRGFKTDNSHRLFYLPFDGESGVGPRVSIELPDFQLHGMRCMTDRISLYAFDAAHSIKLDSGAAQYAGSSIPPDIATLRALPAAPLWRYPET
jgi:hypothetical protein